MAKVKAKKVRVNSSVKGGRWERECSTALSMWVSKSTICRDDLIWRSAGSGSRATNANKRNKDRSGQAGDLVANGTEASALFDRFFVECKSYANFGFQNLLWRGSQGPLSVCIDEPIAKAALHGKWVLLLLRQVRKSPLLVVPAIVGAAIARNWQMFPDVTFAREVSGGKVEYFHVFDFSTFLATVEYTRFLELFQKRGSVG